MQIKRAMIFIKLCVTHLFLSAFPKTLSGREMFNFLFFLKHPDSQSKNVGGNFCFPDFWNMFFFQLPASFNLDMQELLRTL